MDAFGLGVVISAFWTAVSGRELENTDDIGLRDKCPMRHKFNVVTTTASGNYW
jgi:hypothetical protein